VNVVEVSSEGLDRPPSSELVTSFAHAVLDHLGCDDWELSLHLCDADQIRALNTRYRNKDEATDVLSFSQTESRDEIIFPDTIQGVRGDLVVAVPIVQAQAHEFGVSADEELRRVIVHGILHLNGMDHDTNNDHEEMLELQERILEEVPAGEILV
jgi:probable rRNA maturation factor